MDLKQVVNKILESYSNTTENVNSLRGRGDLASYTDTTHQGSRELYTVFGYPLLPSFNEFAAKYERQDIAKRIINAYPEACWKGKLSITDDNDSQEESVFEKETASLFRKLKLKNILIRSDKITGIGQYGVLLVGAKDGAEMSRPIDSRRLAVDDILYLQPYSSQNACIQSVVTDPTDPRYNLPETYKLTTGGISNGENARIKQRTIVVHWSRVIHIAENALENDIFGEPRLLPVLNRLIDLEKVVGGSAETFWLNGREGLAITANGDAHIPDAAAIQEEIEDYQHKLTRAIFGQGIDVKSLSATVADPSSNVDVILQMISSATGIPKRILTGSERGELASSQDEGNWLSRVNERQEGFCEGVMLRPLIDWFIERGVLPRPSGEEYEVIWPPLEEQDPLVMADVAVKKAQAISAYVNSMDANQLITEQQFVEDILKEEFREDDIKDSMDEDDPEEAIEAMET